MNRKSHVCLACLNILKDCEGHALPESTLRDHLNMRLRPAVSDEEAATALEYIKGQGLAKTMPGEFGDDEPRWLITEKGKVVLMEH